MLTAPKMSVYHSPHMIKETDTIKASNPILTVENLQPDTAVTASTHPSPGRGAISAGMYMNIPKAIISMLDAKNSMHDRRDPLNGINDTIYSARSVKYPKRTQFISCSSLFL